MENKVKKIKKRTGEIVDFDQQKITDAVFKAITATGQGDGIKSRKVSGKVVRILNRRFKKAEIPTVEQVQDIVEEVLILEDLVDTARAYILYREQRRRIREATTTVDESSNRVDKYIQELDWQVYENANMTFSLQGLNQYAIADISKKYWLNKIYPKEIRDAAFEEDMHIHDLESISTYCCGWDLYDLLKRGFGGVPGKLECRAPKHLRTALGQLVNFFYTLQGECYSEDTQVLTEAGWKYFYDVDKKDKVFTLDLKARNTEFQEFTKSYVFDNEKELISFKSDKLDLLVTSNHRMVVEEKGILKFIKAKDFNPERHNIPISESGNEKYTSVEKEKVKYSGKVYCLEVPNHTLYVRRKGRACWCGNSAGAQAVSNFDTLIAPFIRYDGLSYPQVKQAMQEFLYNCMVPTRVGFQTPFLNISLDIKPPSFLAKQPVIIGGKPQKENYGDFQEEMNMLLKAFYEGIMEGDAKGRPFTFPIPTVSIGKDFDWDSPALDPLWEATAKYGVNYFSNFIHSDMKPEDFRSMCCRLRLDNKELYMRGGGLFGSQPLTGSIGVVTINLPRIGYLSKTKREFFDRLGHLMDLAQESLEIKRKALDNFAEKGLYPYSKHYLDSVKKIRGSYFGNHFSTIGLMGMNESLMNFIGEDVGSKRGRKFATEILDFMREKLVKYQKDTGHLYNLEATPGEGTSYRQAKTDKEKYPDIITAGTKEAPYYTNSSQLPVNYTDDAFDALKLQNDLQCKYTGGTVLHLFLGEKISDPDSAKMLVKKIFEKFSLPYITLTPTFSICPSHGYLSGEQFECPKCTIKQPCEVYSRIVGYIRPVRQWHTGKKQEFKERKEFKMIKKP